MISRRNLLAALGLGGVGLATGTFSVNGLVQAEETRIDAEHDDTNTVPRIPEASPFNLPPVPQGHDISLGTLAMSNGEPDWIHPDIDKIEAALRETGGFPYQWGTFRRGPVAVIAGDRLNINYVVTWDASDDKFGPEFKEPGEFTLYRVYDVIKAGICVGTSIQGPVMRKDVNGIRLATLDDMVPDNEASLKKNQKYFLD
jgi:hypothetical protein